MTRPEAVFLVTGVLYLQRRVSYQRLSKELGRDADRIAHVPHELTGGRGLAVDEEGAGSAVRSPCQSSSHPGRLECSF